MSMDQLTWETREEALYYESLGMSVFDLPYGSKIPDRSWREFQQTRAPPERLEQMFSTRRNIAIATGKISNLIFLDLDSPEALDEAKTRGYLDITPIISETRRGLQLGFRPPPVPVKNAVKLEGLWDVRSDGGYVVAPSSMHPSGKRYKRLGNWGDTDVPVFPEELIPKEKSIDHRPKPIIDVPRMENVYRYVDKAEPAIAGANGHNRTFGLTCRLVRAFPWLTFDQLMAALMHYNLRCEPPWSEKELLHKATDSLSRSDPTTGRRR